MTEAQTEALLYELCVELGFCLPPDAYSAPPQQAPNTQQPPATSPGATPPATDQGGTTAPTPG